MNILIPVILLIIILTLTLNLLVEKLFVESNKLILVRVILIGIMVNIFIFLYLKLSFSKIKTKVGPQGPRGYRGDKGYIGKVDSCAVCGPQQNTFAYENLDKMKKELVIPQKPLLKKIDIEDKTNYYYKLNKLFTENVGCPIQLVEDEVQAVEIINAIKTELNISSEPSDSQIIDYLNRTIKSRADSENLALKTENYPKCYGVSFIEENTMSEKAPRADSERVRTHSNGGHRFRMECDPGHFINTIDFHHGYHINSIGGICSNGKHLDEKGHKKDNRASVYTGKLSSIETAGERYTTGLKLKNNNYGSFRGNKQTLSCGNGAIVGFYGGAGGELDYFGLICDPNLDM